MVLRDQDFALRTLVGLGASNPTLRIGAPRLNLLPSQVQIQPQYENAREFTWSAALPCSAGACFGRYIAMLPIYCSTVARNLAIDLSH